MNKYINVYSKNIPMQYLTPSVPG